MKELILLIQEGKFIKKDFIDKDDFFKQISNMLIHEGYVIDTFYEGLKEREKTFPTGIQTMSIGVSIPHCENEYVLQDGIIVTAFKHPIAFHRMDKPDETMDVQLSFVLLVKDKEKHLKALQQLVRLFQSDHLRKIADAGSLKEVLDIIKEEVHHD